MQASVAGDPTMLEPKACNADHTDPKQAPEGDMEGQLDAPCTMEQEHSQEVTIGTPQARVTICSRCSMKRSTCGENMYRKP